MAVSVSASGISRVVLAAEPRDSSSAPRLAPADQYAPSDEFFESLLEFHYGQHAGRAGRERQ